MPLGRRAPGFSLPDMRLKQYDIQDYKGKVVVLDFMQTNCGKCRDLTMRLEQLKAKFPDKVVVFSVIITPADNQATITKYTADTKSTSVFLFDCGQMTASYLQITPQNPTVNLPRLLIVDKNGFIRRDLQTTESQTDAALTTALTDLTK